MVRDVDSRCPRGYCPSQNTSIKVQTQGSTMKESKPKESRPKDSKPTNGKTPVLPRTDEPGKISRQDKKKEYLKKKRDWKSFTPAKGDNVIEGEKKRNNKATESTIIVKRRAILLGTARNFQKTSVGLGNFCASDW